ncbi:hypothetical protein Tco_1008558 [Tanacetum coccineum]
MSPENKDHYESEKEAIHLLSTGIGDEIYSTVDTCKTAHEMLKAIERLQQVSSASTHVSTGRRVSIVSTGSVLYCRYKDVNTDS